MHRRDIIAIGGSAGAVDALQKLVAGLPREIPAALFVVMHLQPRSRSVLPELLNRAGPLPAAHPVDHDPIQHGRIYVAPPDRHLLIEDGHVSLGAGPKENFQRPSINVTFRSASLAYGPRVAGVLVSGQLDDGTAGFWDIKRRGGVTIVQNPEEAMFPSMPLSALREIEVDHVAHLAEIGPLLGRLAPEGTKVNEGNGNGGEAGMESNARLVDLTCPECRGNIWEFHPGPGVTEYRCRVGHTYAPRTMLAEHFVTQEKAMWEAIVALEEGSVLAKELAGKLEPELRDRLLEESRQREAHAKEIRRMLEQRKTFSLD